MSEHADLECHNAQAMHNQLCSFSNARWIVGTIVIKSVREREKGKERYPSFGLGLENFSGHITPAVLGKSRFTHCSYPSPSALKSASGAAWEGTRLSLITELPSTARLLFSTSWGNDGMWAAMLLGWDHCQCQSWLAAHRCGLQPSTCNTKMYNCRAEWHLPDDIKQLGAISTGFLGVPLCRGKSWQTETKGQYLRQPMLVTKSEVAFLKHSTPRTLSIMMEASTCTCYRNINDQCQHNQPPGSYRNSMVPSNCFFIFFLRISCCSRSYV